MKFIKIKYKKEIRLGKPEEMDVWINTSHIVTLRKITEKKTEIETTNNHGFITSLSIDELIILINS